MPLGRKDDLTFNKDQDSWTLQTVYATQGRNITPKRTRNPRWVADDPFEGLEPPRPKKKKKKK